MLAGVLLKMGGYGLLRFSLPITPDASRELDWLIIALSLVAGIYIGFVALVQQEAGRLGDVAGRLGVAPPGRPAGACRSATSPGSGMRSPLPALPRASGSSLKRLVRTNRTGADRCRAA